ncbi:MAG: hypothetical protein LQ351_000210 [Letrouitia transgressa]|nr:MAG: hypothetical protein LQ351_000210 [Letrouitia transgressa]
MTKDTATAATSKPGRPSASAPAQAKKKSAKGKKADSPTPPVSNTSKKMVKPDTLGDPPATGGRSVRKQKPNTTTSDRRGSTVSGVELPPKGKEAKEDPEEEVDPHGPSYWLMKAEPESRIEKGKDVKFSIDDLKNATEPEAWDGVRNVVARNNMRQMMEGDIAFFYHSNCKVPGIVGTMEIVREHSVDESAFDPDHPYFDEKSTRDKPKWCVVHVEFRRKFPQMVTLKELQRFAKPNGILENMQVLKLSRLSVSKVTKKEWDFIMGLLETDEGAAAAVHQPQMNS